MATRFLSFKRVTFEQSRQEEAEFWATKSIAERVIAGWELAEERLANLTGYEPKKPTTITVQRVPQSWR